MKKKTALVISSIILSICSFISYIIATHLVNLLMGFGWIIIAVLMYFIVDNKVDVNRHVNKTKDK